MARKYGSEDMDFIESGNWNVAESYSQLKLMKLLKEFDEYRKIARFGATDLLEDFTVTPEIKNESRLKALKWMRELLVTVIENSLFAINKATDRESLQNYLKALKKLEDLYPYVNKVIIRESRRGTTVTNIINEKAFDGIYNVLTKIHMEILFPLNQADLIYSSREEPMTVDELKDRIKDRIINQG